MTGGASRPLTRVDQATTAALTARTSTRKSRARFVPDLMSKPYKVDLVDQRDLGMPFRTPWAQIRHSRCAISGGFVAVAGRRSRSPGGKVHPLGDGALPTHATPSVPAHDVLVSDRMAALLAKRPFVHGPQCARYASATVRGVVVAAVITLELLIWAPSTRY
jgi:hypothetical protein